MRKIVLLSFLSFISFSSKNFAMEEDFTENSLLSPHLQQENTTPKSDISQDFKESDYSQTHPAFAQYIRTGSWGPYAFRYDHLGDLLSGTPPQEMHSLSTTRGHTFYIAETSNRLSHEENNPIHERVEHALTKYTATGDWGAHASRQDHLGDLLFRNNTQQNESLKSTRGTTFYIPLTPSSAEKK